MDIIMLFGGILLTAAVVWWLGSRGHSAEPAVNLPEPALQPQTATPVATVKRKPLNELSAKEIREVAARYGLKITGKVGNTASRILFWLGCSALVFIAFAFVGSFVLGFAPLPVRLGIVTGLWVAVFFGHITPRLFYITVPQLFGAKAMNYFGGRVHIYLPGGNIGFPWEVITENDYLTLRSDVISRPINLTTEDGIGVSFEQSMLRWRVFPALLLLNASHSRDTITKGATDIFETTLSNEVIGTKMADLRVAKKLVKIQENLTDALEGRIPHHLDAHESSFEEQYGVTAEIPALGPPKLSKDYAFALEGRATMRINEQTARELVRASGEGAGPKMEFVQAMNNIMINNGKNVKKDIVEIQMDTNTREAAGDFGKAIGPVIAGAAALARKSSEPKGT